MGHYLHYSRYQNSYKSAKISDFSEIELTTIDDFDEYPRQEYIRTSNSDNIIYLNEAEQIYVREAFAKIMEKCFEDQPITDKIMIIYNKIIILPKKSKL